MAKRRRRRSYGDIVTLNGLTDSFKAFKGSVKATDALLGAGAAIAGIAAVNYLKNMKDATGAPRIAFLSNASIQQYMPAIAGVVAGLGGSMGAKAMKKPSHGPGIMVGAITAGAFLTALNYVKVKYPVYFSDVVDLRLAGLLVDDVVRNSRGYNGLLVDDRAPIFNPNTQGAMRAMHGYSDNPGLGDLAALAMQVDDEPIIG
jgi:hypothetical protein